MLLPIIFAIIGYLVTTKRFIAFLNSLDPLQGLLVYYIAVVTVIILLEHFGLIIAGIHFTSMKQLIGTIMISFSIFIVLIWSNCYVAEVSQGSCSGFAHIYLNTESGATYYLWSKLTDNIELRRILTFVISPFILSLFGLLLISS